LILISIIYFKKQNQRANRTQENERKTQYFFPTSSFTTITIDP